MPPLDPDAKIPCPTPQHLQVELDDLASILNLGEKEETWDKMERALIRFAGVVRGGGYKHMPMFVEGIGRQGLGNKIGQCMLSDRGRLSGAAIDVLQTFAPRLGASFAPLVQVYLEPLVRLLARPNKVFLKRADKCLSTIISHCHLPTIVQELRKGLTDDAAICRRGCATGIERAVKEWDADVWPDKSLLVLEEGIRKMATDKGAEVRQIGKRVWILFMSAWPDRVDDFAAPLTPTIRRYLGVAAANGVPSKPKAATRPPPPVRAVASASSSASTSSQLQIQDKPQPQRVAALAGRPGRPGGHMSTTQSGTAVSASSSRLPSPKKVSPRKASPQKQSSDETKAQQTVGAQPDHAAIPSTAQSSAPSSLNDHPLFLSNALGRYGRSVSHNVLPSTTFFPHSSSEQVHPLSKPSRPMLPSSVSAISLPTEQSDPVRPGPPGRFATGPVRIVRPMPVATDEGGPAPEPVDGFFYTPSGATVLRGPVRPAQVGPGRRQPMGQVHAPRRVVTAPSGMGDGTMAPIQLGKTPAARRVMARPAKEHIVEEDDLATEVDVAGAASVGVPSFVTPPRSTSSTPPSQPVSAIAVEDAKAVSPKADMLPQLDRPVILSGTGLPDDSQHVHEPQGAQRAVESPIPVEVAASIPLPDDKEDQTDHSNEEDIPLSSDNVQTVIGPADSDKDEGASEAVLLSPPAVEQATLAPAHTLSVPNPATAQQSEITSVPPSAASTEVKIPGMTGAVLPHARAASRTEKVREKDVSKPAVPQPVPVRPVISLKPSTNKAKTVNLPQPSAPAAVLSRKPPIPANIPRVPRQVAQVEKKSFRPMTAAAAAAQRAAKAPVKQDAESTRSIIPVTTTAGSGHHSNATAVASAAGFTAATTVPAPIAKAAVRPTAKASTLTQPTKASQSRTAPTVAPRPPPPVAAAVLPPVKKERIKLKAALPSFRPVRNATAGASNTGTVSRSISGKSLASSTSTVTGPPPAASSAIGAPKIIARVKPENIPLPSSPADGSVRVQATQTLLPTSPSPLTKTTIIAKVKPEAIALPPSPVVPTPTKAAEIPLPDSPVTSTTPRHGSSLPNLNALGLPIRRAADDMEVPGTTAKMSKASTATASSEHAGTEDDDDIPIGIAFAFKANSAPTPGARGIHTAKPKVLVLDSVITDKAIVATTLRSVASATATPVKLFAPNSVKGITPAASWTPRRALERRDANVFATAFAGSEEIESDTEY